MDPTRIELEIAPDRMWARVRVVAGEPCEPDALAARIAEAGIVHGVDAAAVERVAQGLGAPDFATAETIANGTPMEPGRDGRLELAFEDGLAAGGEREDGSLDFTERRLLKPVREGDRIATLHPPGEGKPGRGVDGEEIPAQPGREVATALGEGVRTGDEGAILASVAGAVHHQPGRLIEIVDHHVHAADVDLHSGNLAMKGSLSISGDVCLNLRAEADRDLEVKGSVDGGRVSAGGSVRVGRGLIGRERGRIAAEADVTVHHVQDARIVCGGVLRVGADVVKSRVHASDVQIGGRAIGGAILAERSISLRQAGSASGAPTTLRAAEPVPRPLAVAIASLNETKAARLGRVSRRGKRDGPRGRTRRMTEAAELKRKQQLAQRRRALLEHATIEIREAVLDGVRLAFSIHRRVLEGGCGPARFRYDRESDAIVRTEIGS
ncbi:MAG: DUF342 domain-containing protein [Myxococcales bacterium]|nr:DUF342 domain-containing protein [Myxococcales bacterium]